MGSFEVLNDYRKKIKKMFLQNKDLQKLVFYNDLNPLQQKDLLNPNILWDGGSVIENGKTVLKNPCVIFGEKKFDTVTDNMTFIIIDMLSSKIHGSIGFKEFHIMITIACHNSIVNLNDGEIRYHKIADEIDKFLNGHRHFGFSRVRNSNEFKRVAINDTFEGVMFFYNVNGRSMNYHNNNG